MTAAVEPNSPPDVEGARQRSDGLWVFSREEFVHRRFDYKPGEHLVFGGPTQRGKTTLAFALLEVAATPDCPAYIAVSKPRDPTTEREGKRLGFVRVTEWPPPMKLSRLWGERPPGYLVWPKFGDIDNDVARSARVTKALLNDRYTAGVRNHKGILVMDDTVVKSKVLGLDGEMTTILAMASAMDLGLWTFVQKPTDSGRTAIWAYGASEHVFMTHDPDRKNQQRYSEIGGVDPKFIGEATRSLKPYEFLYFKRTEDFVCVVGAK